MSLLSIYIHTHMYIHIIIIIIHHKKYWGEGWKLPEPVSSPEGSSNPSDDTSWIHNMDLSSKVAPTPFTKVQYAVCQNGDVAAYDFKAFLTQIRLSVLLTPPLWISPAKSHLVLDYSCIFYLEDPRVEADYLKAWMSHHATTDTGSDSAHLTAKAKSIFCSYD